MPQTKRSREASQDSADDATASKRPNNGQDEDEGSPSLAGFLRLPLELRSMIIELCIASSPSTDSTSTTHNLDISPVMGLLTASRDLYMLVAPLLYPKLFAAVYFQRPSSLPIFRDVIVANPSLRSLVKRLRFGGDECSSGRWPHKLVQTAEQFEDDRGNYKMFHGFEEHEMHLLPEWCKVNHCWSHVEGQDDCQSRHVLNAIDTAQKALSRIYTNQLDCPPIERRNGLADTFIVDVSNVQAALDLYLLEMRRVEDRKARACEPSAAKLDCKDVTCGHYPRLHVDKTEKDAVSTASGGFALESDGTSFVVTKPMLRAHLSRRCSKVDEFCHMLAMARSKKRAWYFISRARLEGDAKTLGAVDMNDPQAKAMEVNTFNGAIAMIRSVLSLTKPRHVAFDINQMADAVQGGWDQRLLEVGRNGPYERFWRYAAEDEEDPTGKDRDPSVGRPGDAGATTE